MTISWLFFTSTLIFKVNIGKKPINIFLLNICIIYVIKYGFKVVLTLLTLLEAAKCYSVKNTV